MSAYDITVVINGHREGLLARPSLVSARRAVERAKLAGLRVQVIGVLDRPDALTRDVFEEFFAEEGSDWGVAVVEHGDPGKSRNAGIALAEAKWATFLDADDLWCHNWLASAYKAAEADERCIIWHPHVNVYFGHNSHCYVHVDMDDSGFSVSRLAIDNYWTSLSFLPVEFARRLPYPGSQLSDQLGYEDWSWNMEAIAQGAIHKVVSGTAHAIRQKRQNSVNSVANSVGALPMRTTLFRSILSNSS